MADNLVAWLAIAAFFAIQGALYVYAADWLTLAWVAAIIAATPVLLWREFG